MTDKEYAALREEIKELEAEAARWREEEAGARKRAREAEQDADRIRRKFQDYIAAAERQLRGLTED